MSRFCLFFSLDVFLSKEQYSSCPLVPFCILINRTQALYQVFCEILLLYLQKNHTLHWVWHWFVPTARVCLHQCSSNFLSIRYTFILTNTVIWTGSRKACNPVCQKILQLDAFISKYLKSVSCLLVMYVSMKFLARWWALSQWNCNLQSFCTYE